MAIWEKITTVTTPTWTSVSEITTPTGDNTDDLFWSPVTILNSITYLLRNVWESFTVLSWDNEVRRWEDLTN